MPWAEKKFIGLRGKEFYNKTSLARGKEKGKSMLPTV